MSRRAGRMAAVLALLAATLPLAPGSLAQNACTEDAMIVFDGSGSMAEMGFNHIDEPQIFEARRAMAEAIPGIAETRCLGLMIYGPGPGDVCAGIDLRFAPMHDAAPAILDAVNALQPAGETALTEAVAHAGAGYREAETPARCLADRTGGLHVGAETVEDLVAALRKTPGCNVLF